MSIEHVKAFYQRLAQDLTFKAQIEKARNKQECSQIIQKAGYDFTQEEFEEFTAQLLDSGAGNLRELDETELEAAVGGADAFFQDKKINPIPIYGLPPSSY